MMDRCEVLKRPYQENAPGTPKSLRGKPVRFPQAHQEKGNPVDKQKVIGILSGADAQGINATLRSFTRAALHNQMKVFAIHEGCHGLLEGGDKIEVLEWSSVSGIIHKSGSIIGAAECTKLSNETVKLAAVKTLVKREINNLVVIGGGRSLTLVYEFQKEWKQLLQKLVQSGEITREMASSCGYLNLACLVGSIENDMCGTDVSIGTDSALHRITEAIDNLTCSASSRQQISVLEVMGDRCGYLALKAAIAGSADWVLVPESPPDENWEGIMCERLLSRKNEGCRHSLIIMAEGAVDHQNKQITSHYIKEIIEERVECEAKITVLGFVQRGGKTSAYDRTLGCRMGAIAAVILHEADKEIPPVLIGVQDNDIVKVPLQDCVDNTRDIAKAMKECQFDQVLEVKGSSFKWNFNLFKRLESCDPKLLSSRPHSGDRYRFAVMTVGAPAAGMNSCVRAFVRLLLYQGHTVLGVTEGFAGLLQGSVREMTWKEVDGWGSSGGSNLGTIRESFDEKDLPEIEAKIYEYYIQGLLIIGGFETLECLVKLEKHRKTHAGFRIPLLGIAATISNNVPGTDMSLGCDTALNAIVAATDTLNQSASASRKRVFVVETMGGYCGYLPTLACLASGGDMAYIFEEKLTIDDIQRDARYLVEKFKNRHFKRGLMLRGEQCNQSYTTDFLLRLLSEESRGEFKARSLILGHLQQGENPSPYDRILGVKYASNAVDFLIKHASENTVNGKVQIDAIHPKSACMLGVHGKSIKPTELQEVHKMADFEHRIPHRHQQWWMSLRPLINVMSQHP